MSFLWWWKTDSMRKSNVNTSAILLSRHGEGIMFVVHLTVDKWMVKSVILLPYISWQFNHCDIDRTKIVFTILKKYTKDQRRKFFLMNQYSLPGLLMSRLKGFTLSSFSKHPNFNSVYTTVSTHSFHYW